MSKSKASHQPNGLPSKTTIKFSPPSFSKFVLAFSVFLVGYNLFFYYQPTGFAYPICLLLLNLVFFITRSQGSHPYAWFLSIIAVTLSSFTAIFDHSTNNYLNYPLSILATILSWLTYHDSLPTFPINLSDLFSKLPRLRFQIVRPEGSFKYVWKHLLPGLLGLIFGLVLVNLLSFADPIFKHSTQFLFDFLKQNFIQRLVNTLFVSLYISPLLFLYFLPLKYSESHSGQSKNLFELFSQWASLFGSITYLIFLAIQFDYLFFHHNPDIPGFTYSSYVKAGFAELILASVLTLVVAQIKKTKLSSLLTFLTFGLLFLNTYKLFLYIQLNGLTRARILGTWFLIWLFALLLIQLFRHHLFSKLFIPTTFLILVLLNLLPTDKLLLYTFPPKVNGQIDYDYLTYKLDTNSAKLWADLIISNTQNIETITSIDPKKITKEQFDSLHSSVSILRGIKFKIGELILSNGNPTEVYNFLYTNWSIGTMNSDTQRMLLDQLRDTKQFNSEIQKGLNLPPRSWQYKNLSRTFAYNFFSNIWTNEEGIEVILQKDTWYEHQIPENLVGQFMQ